MDHHEQHHQHHIHQREEKKKEEKAYEQREEKNRLPIHPAWIFTIGVVLVVTAILIWTFFLR